MANYLDFIKGKSAAIIECNESIKGTKLCDVYKNLKDAEKRVKKIGGEVAETYWDTPLTREEVRVAFEKDVYKGFVTAMLWGGLGSNGQSFNHLEKALEKSKKEEVIRKLNSVKELISQGKIGDAFLSMCFGGDNKIDGVDVSYFTKILFFMSDINSSAVIPLIYDKWGWHIHAAILLSNGDKGKVLQFFNILASLKKGKENQIIINPTVVLPSSKKMRIDAYEDYINVIYSISQAIPKKPSPGNLEQYLFGYSRAVNDPVKNPRVQLVTYLNNELTKLIKEAEIKVTEDGIDSIDKVESEDGIFPVDETTGILKRSGEQGGNHALFGYRFHYGEGDLYLYVGEYNTSKKIFCQIFQKKRENAPILVSLDPEFGKKSDPKMEHKPAQAEDRYIRKFKVGETDNAKKLMDSLKEPIARAIWGDEADKYLHPENS